MWPRHPSAPVSAVDLDGPENPGSTLPMPKRGTMRLLAIDPGDTQSGVALIDTTDCRPTEVEKVENRVLRARLLNGVYSQSHTVIEMVASYGMAVGKEVFDTCVWIGRFDEAAFTTTELVYRRVVKLHLCGQTRAKDANITQALVDRFAPGQRNRGKGTKASPGWFYGFNADIWQAYALAVTVADRIENRQP